MVTELSVVLDIETKIPASYLLLLKEIYQFFKPKLLNVQRILHKKIQ